MTSPRLHACCAALVAAAAVGWLPAPAHGLQAGLGAAQQASPALARLPLFDLLKRRDQAAAGELARRFVALQDKLDKQQIASVLLSRRQGDQPYFDYLAGYARQAVESDAPFPYGFDEAGKVIPGQYSAEFSNWAAARKLAPDAAAAQVFQGYPLDVTLLALADDPRSTEILLRGVESPNYMVAYRAAFGLARLGYKAAIPRIIKAADRAPGEASELIARNLVLFDDPQAQAAAERLIKDRQLLAALRANSRRELTLNIGGD
jgi:hypothetical protein